MPDMRNICASDENLTILSVQRFLWCLSWKYEQDLGRLKRKVLSYRVLVWPQHVHAIVSTLTQRFLLGTSLCCRVHKKWLPLFQLSRYSSPQNRPLCCMLHSPSFTLTGSAFTPTGSALRCQPGIDKHRLWTWIVARFFSSVDKGCLTPNLHRMPPLFCYFSLFAAALYASFTG